MFFNINLKKFKNFSVMILHGAFIGASLIIPGLSGGTTAIILGVFDKMLSALSNIVKDFKKSFCFLLPYGIGGILGILIMSYPLGHIIKNYNIVFSYFIFGLIIGSIPVFFPKNKASFRNNLLFAFVGTIPVIISYIISTIRIDASKNVLLTVFVGFLSAIALILPGISLTNVLIVFGCYDEMILSINEFKFTYLLCYGLSLLVGVILSIKVLTKMYQSHTEKINMAMLGMIITSLPQIYIAAPSKNDIFLCTLLFISGLAIGLRLGIKE